MQTNNAGWEGVCGGAAAENWAAAPRPGDLDHPSSLHVVGAFPDLCCGGPGTLSLSFFN